MTYCGTCRHSRPVITDDDETPILECWRYPPVMIWADDEILSVRPSVVETDTCGEYAA
jgi:hypothetical protein